MFDNTLELAENKLLLLYVFNEIKLPVSNNQITQIILENNFINYFTLQQYISELVSSEFIKYIEDNDKHRLIITEKGSNVLSLFKNRISDSKLNAIDHYLKHQMENIKKEITVSAEYTIEKENNYIVNLKFGENDTDLINIKINVSSNKEARDICTNWKSNSSKLYENIKSLLDAD